MDWKLDLIRCNSIPFDEDVYRKKCIADNHYLESVEVAAESVWATKICISINEKKTTVNFTSGETIDN